MSHYYKRGKDKLAEKDALLLQVTATMTMANSMESQTQVKTENEGVEIGSRGLTQYGEAKRGTEGKARSLLKYKRVLTPEEGGKKFLRGEKCTVRQFG